MTFQTRAIQPHFAFADDSPWQRCIDAWLTENYQRSHSEQTLKEYRRTIVMFFNQVQKAPDQVTRQDALDFLYSPCQSDRNKGAEPTIGTVHTRLSIISSFFKYSATYTVEVDGRLEPLLKHVAPTVGMKVGQPAPAIRALSVDELGRLLAAIPQTSLVGLRDRALTILYVTSARRRSEVGAMRWGAIQPTVFVDKDGTRRAGHTFRFFGKGHSIVEDAQELSPLAYQAILTYLEADGRLATIKPEDPIFAPTMNGGATGQLSDTSINRRIKYYARKAGLGDAVSLHALRHTSATLRVQSGEELLDVMRTLRHHSLDHTYRYVQRLASPADPGITALESTLSRLL